MMLREFHNFMIELAEKSVSDDVKRMGNIILKYLNEIIPLSTAYGQRSKKIIELAQNEFEKIVPQITVSTESNQEDEFAISRLKSIEIESFRGFNQKEIFDIDAPIVLLYGPNGSGKTSFCEALEYSLLGFVEEAEVKRFSNTDYLKNARTDRLEFPILKAINAKGEMILVSQNDAIYRFCFVEKNRIDDFSRMAAKLPAQQNKLIGTLFGLDSFDEFVKGFSNELDSRYIDLIGQKTIELQEKRKTLSADEQIAASAEKDFEELTSTENKTVSEFKSDMNYPDFVAYLGTIEKPGRIQELEQLIEKQIPKKIGLTLSILKEIDNSLTYSLEKINSYEKTLEAKRNQISFRNLYRAVKELHTENPDICPACSTPLKKVAQDPYLRAENGLKELENLSELEQNLSDYKAAQQKSLSDLFQLVKSAVDFEQTCLNHELTNVPNSEKEMTCDLWLNFKQDSGDDGLNWQKLENIISKIEEYDNKIEELENERDSYIVEIKQLRIYREEVVRHDEARKKKNETIEKAKKNIIQFETDNKKLIEEVESEKQNIETNKRIAGAYKIFVEELNIYRKELPEKLIADLADKVKELYNGFNRADQDGDLLAEIRLPLVCGSKIEVAFNSEPTHFFDALHVLSEGHIRCLGLSILLAKNLKQKCPLLIFDDPVNAIDDDHREGIRRTIFEDSLFADSQIILTCHGEEFFKDVQNLLGVKKVKETKAFTFIPHIGDNQIIVDSSPTPRNYVVAARNHFSKGEIRESLAKSRRALEFLANETWKFVAKYGDGSLALTIKGPKERLELRNLIEKLSSKVKKSNFIHNEKDKLSSALSSLLGIDGQSREWRYLNGGTHEEEDREEFDRPTVQTIVESLEKTDEVIRAE